MRHLRGLAQHRFVRRLIGPVHLERIGWSCFLPILESQVIRGGVVELGFRVAVPQHGVSALFWSIRTSRSHGVDIAEIRLKRTM